MKNSNSNPTNKKSIIKRVGTTIKNGAVDTISAGLGIVHFTADTIAEVSLHAEAKLKMHADGVPMEETKRTRCMKTAGDQQLIIDVSNHISTTAARKARDISQFTKKTKDKAVNLVTRKKKETDSQPKTEPVTVSEPAAHYVKQVVYTIKQAVYKLDGTIDATLQSVEDETKIIKRNIKSMSGDRLHTINVIVKA